jgi:histidyl-tRNA synthetase
MEALGIPRGRYLVKVNSRKVLDGILETIGLAGAHNEQQKLIVLRAIDKYDRLGMAGAKELLGPGRKDASGDFTKGAGLSAQAIETVLSIFERASDGGDKFAHLDATLAGSKAGEQGRGELRKIEALVEAARYGTDRIAIDPSVVRGLEYYTGAVYEIELSFPITSEDSAPVRFGSVGGGGRYDGLIGRFRSDDVPATGVSIGVSRLAAALGHLGNIDLKAQSGPIVVTVMDGERLPDYQNMVAQLRGAGLRAELYLGGGKMGAQLKYADKRASPCVVIQGADEKQRGEVQIKDLIEGAKAAGAIATHTEWREARPAQFAVPEDKLVETVREVLRRHEIAWE